MTDFICRRCGECCGAVWFTKTEYKAVFRVASKLGVSLVKQYLDGKPVYVPRQVLRQSPSPRGQIRDLVIKEGFVCPFLGKDKEGKALCRIYELRPELCRKYGIDPRMECPKQTEGDVNVEQP